MRDMHKMLWENKEGVPSPDERWDVKKASLKVEMPKQSTQESTGTTQNNVGKRIPESSMWDPTSERASSVSRVGNEK